MNQLFEYFLNNYLDGEKVDNKNKGYHKALLDKIPAYIRNIVGDNYKVKGSCGASNKAEIPWIGVFNKKITDTAQYGLYIVYLFKSDMSGFYLCLGQGVTNFEKYGSKKEEIMFKVANYFKEKVDEIFSKDSINLLSRSSKGKLYEKVNILNKYYDKRLILTYNFEKDLKEMLNIYEEIVDGMNKQSYDEIIDNLISNYDPNYIVAKEADVMLEQELLKEEHLEEADIMCLTRIDIPEGMKETKYSEIERKHISKIDYAKKQKKNAYNGLLGERLVMKYEKDKLRKAGHEDLIKEIKWVSKEDDHLGYDIISFDENGNKIYIEVKSTEGNDNSVFFISTNECDAMDRYKSDYYIYRVVKVKSKNPEVFVLNYNDFKKRIKLKIENYRASLISE